MKTHLVSRKLRFVAAALITTIAGLQSPAQADSASRTFTFNSDFDQGLLVNVNHTTNDQLQLNSETGTFPFIWVACSSRGTVTRINVSTGAVLGEYLMSPNGFAKNPSRTTVDAAGNVWVGSRDEGSSIDGTFGYGSVVKIGVVVGGTRGYPDGQGGFVADPQGQYLKPPFQYSTAVDRDGDGLIRTSRGLGNILNWNNVTDGNGGGPAMAAAPVEDAEDECILIYQRLKDAPGCRHLSVARDNNVWVGGYPFDLRRFYKLDGNNGAALATFDARTFGAGGYGGLIDGNGILWSSSISHNATLRYDTTTGTGTAIPVSQSYGMGIDSAGNIWNSGYGGQITKITPAGTVVAGFPKSTGGSETRGVAVTVDDNIWVANSAQGNVVRFDNAGNVRKVISTGAYPTGVAVDSFGKVWVTNFNSNNTVRINPSGGTDGLGEIDLTVDLGPGAGPYNYSDMTGKVLLGAIQQGFWSVVHDGGTSDIAWNAVSWNADTPADTGVAVSVRASNSQAGLSSLPFTAVVNGSALSAISGRYIEVRTTLSRSGGTTATPVLFDLTVQGPRERDFIAVTGQTVPNDPLNVQWKSFGAPAVNDYGFSAFVAKLRSGVATVSTANAIGVFTSDANGPQLLAQTGSVPAGVTDSTIVFSRFADVMFNDFGEAAFYAQLKATDKTTTTLTKDNDSGVWQTLNGTLTLVAREGGEAAGVPGAKFSKFLSVALPARANLVFYGSLKQGVGGVSSVDDTGLWAVGSTGQLELLLREGQMLAVPPMGLLTVKRIDALRAVSGAAGQGHSINSSGEVVARVTFATREQAIVVCSTSNVPQIVAISGTSTPAEPIGAIWKTFGVPSINDAGDVAFAAKLATGSGGVVPANNEAIFAESGGGPLMPVVRKGLTVLGASGIASKLGDPVFNNFGDIAFAGEALNVGVKTKGIWSNFGGALSEVATIGGAPAGVPGATFKKISSLALSDNGVLFVAQLTSGVGGITSSNDVGLWGPEANGSLAALVREGQTLNVDGTPKAIRIFSALRSVFASSGQRRTFNSRGDIVIQAAFTDRTEGVFVIRSGELQMME
ncbi:MAG: hypothetical protein RL088_1726 [Verrucomicrobiota bacterium]